MPDTTIINREAGDKAKGPRLQRLRCVELLLDAIEKSARPHVYAAVEHKDDVFLKDAISGKDYLEQNKNYSESSSFTFNSPEVKNTMVCYLDMWMEYGIKSKDVFFGFYATNCLGKEQKISTASATAPELPDKPILELLKSKDLDYPNLLPAVKVIVLEEYKKQYASKNISGYTKNIEAFTDSDWKQLLEKIDWNFESDDEEATQKNVIGKIKACKFFNHSHIGLEDSLLRNLMDLLDERQCIEDLLGKFVSGTDVENVYLKTGALTESSKNEDPIYKMWASLPAPTDKRNILDKMNAVCTNIDPKRLKIYARKTAGSRILQEEKESDKSFLSLRYRIFEKCEEKLQEYLSSPTGKIFANTQDIDKLFDFLFNQVQAQVAELSDDFQYSMKSQPVIEGIVCELFDSCYLALDNE